MFDISWGELMLIGVVALIVIGPKELPGVLRTTGVWMGKIRRMANEFQDQFQEALREAEFADLKKHADDLSSSVSEFGKIDPIGDVQRDVERTLQEPSAEANAPAAAQPSSPPPIDMPLPEAAPAVRPEDFASAEAAPTKKAAKEPAKQGGSGG